MQNYWFVKFLEKVQFVTLLDNTMSFTALLVFYKGFQIEKLYEFIRIYSLLVIGDVPAFQNRQVPRYAEKSWIQDQTPDALYAAANLSANALYNSFNVLIVLLVFLLVFGAVHYYLDKHSTDFG